MVVCACACVRDTLQDNQRLFGLPTVYLSINSFIKKIATGYRLVPPGVTQYLYAMSPYFW